MLIHGLWLPQPVLQKTIQDCVSSMTLQGYKRLKATPVRLWDSRQARNGLVTDWDSRSQLQIEF